MLEMFVKCKCVFLRDLCTVFQHVKLTAKFIPEIFSETFLGSITQREL